jgi:hypothetical protein
MIGHATRRALHQCVDLLCDALAEDAEEGAKKKKVSRGPARPVLPDVELDARVVERVSKRWEKAGYKKVG